MDEQRQIRCFSAQYTAIHWNTNTVQILSSCVWFFFVGWFLCLRRSKFRFRICHYQFNRRRSLPLYQLFMVLVCLFICSLSKVHGATQTASYHNFKGNHRANNVNVNVSLWLCEYFSHDEVAMCIVVIRERERRQWTNTQFNTQKSPTYHCVNIIYTTNSLAHISTDGWTVKALNKQCMK